MKVRTLALAHELETFLAECKKDLLIVAQGPVASSGMVHFLESRKNIGKLPYKELAYISQKGEGHVFLIVAGHEILVVPGADVSIIQPNPYLLADKVRELRRGEVWISDIVEAIYPFPLNTDLNQKLSAKIVRLATPCFDEDNSINGFLLLSIDVYQIREILSLFNSSKSPIFAYPRGPEIRFCYLFDRQGWIFFQSEQIGEMAKELSTDLARMGLSGMFGKPGIERAFRPDSTYDEYWRMVNDVGGGKYGLMFMTDKNNNDSKSMTNHFFVGYAPIHFNMGRDQEPAIYAGVALVDRSRLPLWAGYRQIDVMFVITLLSIVIISVLIYGLSRAITGPIRDLAVAVNRIQATGKLQEINLPDHDDETTGLKTAVNKMVVTLRNQIEEIRVKDEMLEKESQREKARLEEEVDVLKKRLQSHTIEEIVGIGLAIESLKSDIIKAASVDADVLIIGETGTGKQLAAEAIHRHGSRAEKPFISINCGELDENLLLDTLFGHVKGAFTEAKADRKGAFLAADGGTLFLDEIGTASLRVQQALLRAIALRKVKALGSDTEVGVNVRLITASNVDLKELIERGIFRGDLYYRLEVLTIHTPSLRDHKENIPVLIGYFLKQAGRLMNKEDVGLSRGALEKMKNYHWPGNVRELMNCVTRSLVMVEGKLIQAEDIRLGGEEPIRRSKKRVSDYQMHESQPPIKQNEALPPDLNPRQRKAFPAILRNGEITRSQYQEVVGNNLPSRTALYDLHDLVKRDLLKKTGRGPATRYYLAELPDSAR
ncbi:MAG: sigma 54-interacting transcriptional regulator [Desulfobacterales bacterium]|nr:sigma 54-interacting transcriptional regulator [Desulfobacterales bacterium]